MSNIMKNSICNKHFHPVLFISSLLLLWFNTTTSTPFGHQSLGATPGRSRTSNYKCADKERNALFDFKSHVYDPFGYLSTWATNDEETSDCCQWRGVTCNNQTGHVITLDLGGGGLRGKVSPSLLNLTYLNHLDLSYSSFNGTIPTFIGSMTQLRYLDLCFNDFTGNIPKFIGSMTQLRHLGLGSNEFTGTIPMFIGSMTQLKYLDLGWNDFTGTIPSELGNLTNLQELSIDSVNNCTIKNLDWLSYLPQLEVLSMNGISLAKENNWVNMILSLQKLSSLSLGGCNLSQVMHPYSYSHVNSSSSIVTLFLDNNNLNSSMYHWLSPLVSDKLAQLVLSGNKLDKIPKYLGNVCSLKSLYISTNSVPIKLPDFLRNLSGCTSMTLQKLYASGSRFIGSLSDDIQRFSSLKSLDLPNNELNGTISEMLWELPNLKFLDLSSNSLKGTIFKNIGKSKILTIDLSNNLLEGFSSKVDTPDLSNGIKTTNTSYDNFYGQIANGSTSVTWLDLSQNKLYGRVSFLCKFVDSPLLFLDLSYNSLMEIPDCIWYFTKIQVLNLAYNKLFGRLPACVGSLINLEVLYLNNNNLSGDFPLALKNYTKLKFLHLGANRFFGNVPFWIGERLSLLYALILSSNNFSGMIPLQLCQLRKLQILDLSMNNLHGTIPTCLNNLTAIVQDVLSSPQKVRYLTSYGVGFGIEIVNNVMMHWQGNARDFSSNLGLMKIIDLSSNNLTGKIPDKLTDLHNLIALNLSMNFLNGEIPPKIGLMKELQILDISKNNLSGGIPSEMSKMTLLNYLDISYNNLSGRIPSGTQLQSFDPSRYNGNVGLCGLPLSIYCPKDKEIDISLSFGGSEDGEENIDDLNRWFYTGGAYGFAIGFWTVCSGFLLNR